MELREILAAIQGKLIVSVQPNSEHPELDPMNDGCVMSALAQSVLMGGAAAIRANGVRDLTAIRAVTQVPLIGLYKLDIDGFEVRITPTIECAKAIAATGIDIIAVDSTNRPRPGGLSAPEFIQLVKHETGLPLMADISTFEEGLSAADAGADFVGTTLSGYTKYSPKINGPDFELVERLVGVINVPVIAEGRIHTPQEAIKLLRLGAFAVTVGSAITRPRSITSRFCSAIESLE